MQAHANPVKNKEKQNKKEEEKRENNMKVRVKQAGRAAVGRRRCE